MRSIVGIGESLRPWPVYLLAASLPFSIAAVSIAKLFLILGGLIALLSAMAQNRQTVSPVGSRSMSLVLIMLATLAFSTVYTVATREEATHDWAKYAKLLLIVLVPVLIRSRRQAGIVLVILVFCQTFVSLTSFLMSLGFHVPWVPADRFSPMRMSMHGHFAAYSSYIDQGLMTVGAVVMFWHFRDSSPSRWGRQIALSLGCLNLLCALVLLPGRTGHVALFVVLLMAGGWHWRLQKERIFWLAPIAIAIVTVTLLIPSSFRDRMLLVVTEVQTYSNESTPNLEVSSSGIRLNLWHKALQSMADAPLLGHGIASYSAEFQRFEATPLAPGAPLPRHNAHQEFLQWGVQLGLLGMALLIALFTTLTKDAQQFPAATRRAMQSIVAVFAVACLFNSALYDALIGDYFCGALGMLLALGITEIPPTLSANTEHKH